MDIHISACIGFGCATDLALVAISLARQLPDFAPVAAIVRKSATFPVFVVLATIANAAASAGTILGDIFAPLIGEKLRTANGAGDFGLRIARFVLALHRAILDRIQPVFLD